MKKKQSTGSGSGGKKFLFGNPFFWYLIDELVVIGPSKNVSVWLPCAHFT